MESKLPAGDGFYCEGISGGRLRVHTVRRGKRVGYLDCEESDLGALADTLLRFAALVTSYRVDPGKSLLGSDFTGSPVKPTRVGLVGHPDPSLMVVAFQVGWTQIGFELRRDQLREMGRTFLAASADDATSN